MAESLTDQPAEVVTPLPAAPLRIEDLPLDPRWIGSVPIPYARRAKVLPFAEHEGVVQVAVGEGEDPTATIRELIHLRAVLKMPVAAVPMPPALFESLVNRGYDALGSALEDVPDLAGEGLDALAQDLVPADLLDAEDDAPIIRLVNGLLSEAVKDRASDIHIEPYERGLTVRFRVDGVLHNVLRPPKAAQAALTSRIKIQAGLDIAEKRIPQDGRIALRVAGREVDVRVSTLPTSHGERIVMRLLDKGGHLLTLPELGIPELERAAIEKMIQSPHGILLVTGPTGSGKSTTLYGALTTLNTAERNIITVEDPVEYQLAGVGQIQVNAKVGLTFASGLRAILRQDPDVIMVGEIRDRETAEIAIQASLTGHLVFSTLHTNDAATAATRLIDMGVEPFLVGSSLIGILAQRLVRRLCPHCRREAEVTAAVQEELESVIAAPVHFHPEGCDKCLGTGYIGRVGIYELIVVDDALRDLIQAGVPSSKLRDAAKSKGMHTLRDSGARLVAQGVTSVEEVLRVTRMDL